QPYHGALAHFALDINLAAVPFHHTKDHRQAQARSALALRRIKRLKATPARFFAHAHAGVPDFQHDVGRHALRRTSVAHTRPDGYDATIGDGIHSVHDEICQRLADFAFKAHQRGEVRVEITAHFNHHTASLGNITPARAGHINHLPRKVVEIERLQRL